MNEPAHTAPKKRKLTKKQRGFVRDYVLTENGTQAALKNYDTTDPNTANQIALDNLQKPTVIEAIQEKKKSIADVLSDEMLAQAHKELMNQTRAEYFVFPKSMKDDEVEDKVNAAGFDLIVIRDGDKGRYAFYATIDAQARRGALDMAYKIKGTYAPEKSVNVNVELEASDEIRRLADELNAIHTRDGEQSNGAIPGSVGEEVQNKE